MNKKSFLLLFWILRLFLCCITGGLLAWWILPHIYIQRGYFAVGGEWALILIAACFPLLRFHKIFK